MAATDTTIYTHTINTGLFTCGKRLHRTIAGNRHYSTGTIEVDYTETSALYNDKILCSCFRSTTCPEQMVIFPTVFCVKGRPG